jgi:HSP20 family protein
MLPVLARQTPRGFADGGQKEGDMLARDIIPRKIESVFDRFDPFFSGDFLPRVAWPRKLEITAEWRPSADVIENKDEYLVKCELPEVKREDVKLDLADGMLRIRGERRLDIDEKKDKVHRVESF